MTDDIKSIGSSAGNPSPEGRPTGGHSDQFHIMQSLMEIQKDVSALSTKTDRLISDVNKLDGQVDAVRSKISRFEGVGVGSILILTLLGAVVWWMIGGQITQLRDQIYEFQHERSQDTSAD